jgi:hypothetical protein
VTEVTVTCTHLPYLLSFLIHHTFLTTIPSLDLGHLRKADAYNVTQWFWAQAEWIDRQQFVFYFGLTSYFMGNE